MTVDCLVCGTVVPDTGDADHSVAFVSSPNEPKPLPVLTTCFYHVHRRGPSSDARLAKLELDVADLNRRVPTAPRL